MTQATMRAAIVAWAKAQTITGLGTIYKDAPWWLPDIAIAGANAVVTDPTTLYGAALFVHLDQSSESRITVPAVSGYKNVTYSVTLGLVYRYLIPNDLGGQLEDAWVDGLDSIIDGLKAAIRAQPMLGAASSVIFQAGQQDAGVSIVQDLPVMDGGYIRCLARLQFLADEIIMA